LTDALLEGRTALVTGASRGIGAAIAASLAGAGVRVALVARTREKLEEVAAKIGNGAFVAVADLSDEKSAASAAADIRKELNSAPDILVNNAGLFRIVELADMGVSDFADVLRTNLLAPFLMLHEFLPLMRQRGSGHVITIGSSADRRIFAGNGAYSATKYGMRAVHEVLREETRGTGIRTTLISPAGVDTDIWDPIRFLGSTEPPDRKGMLNPSVVADAVLYAVTRPSAVNIDELRLSRS
jgi:NADP-dependent 3-hydroxy acid dehydrogenase YdfG